MHLQIKFLILYLSAVSSQGGIHWHSASCPAEANTSEGYLEDTRQWSISGNLWENFSHWATWLAISAQLRADYIQYTVILPFLPVWTVKEANKPLTGESWGWSWKGRRKKQVQRLLQPVFCTNLSITASSRLFIIAQMWNSCCNNCYNRANSNRS